MVIEKLIKQEKYTEAARLIRKELRAVQKLNKDPFELHWLYTTLGLCYYERKKYEQSLKYDELALKLAPNCPMVLWNYGSGLSMLDRDDEAIAVFKKILKRGVTTVAYGQCGEGLSHARAMLNDCRYHIARCYQSKGNKKEAKKWITLCLKHRCKGCIFSKKEVNKLLTEVS